MAKAETEPTEEKVPSLDDLLDIAKRAEAAAERAEKAGKPAQEVADTAAKTAKEGAEEKGLDLPAEIVKQISDGIVAEFEQRGAFKLDPEAGEEEGDELHPDLTDVEPTEEEKAEAIARGEVEEPKKTAAERFLGY